MLPIRYITDFEGFDVNQPTVRHVGTRASGCTPDALSEKMH
jgi:hypothetical protein